MRIAPAGDRALLVDLDDVRTVAAHHAGWAVGHPGIAEMIPAAATVLVILTEDAEPARVSAWLRETPPAQVLGYSGETITIDVRYDGPDLDEVCATTGLDIVAVHTGQVWTAAFCGFSPGFAYLVGSDPLSIPRRADPRTSVPAGSVALAGEYTGVYPTSSPGGWQIIGSTDAALWDVNRDDPALLAPGTRVQFRAVT
ncbi:allophanate hydrolase subunit 1 [Rhodococcus sp. NBC_00297]|nr:allophanate hydrolase subunit 1 [Rhodococcus sp. NBC_00297]